MTLTTLVIFHGALLVLSAGLAIYDVKTNRLPPWFACIVATAILGCSGSLIALGLIALYQLLT